MFTVYYKYGEGETLSNEQADDGSIINNPADETARGL
jgi:hypothetical protein